MDRYSDLIELPSQGRLYDGRLPGGEIEIYAMGVKEEALLIGKDNKLEASRALDRLLESCIKTDFPLDDVLMSDRFYILLMIRKISYSPVYTYDIKCPICKARFKHTIEIPGSFSVTLLDDGTKEPFFVDLPLCGKRVGFRLLRSSDEKDTQMYIRNQVRASKDKITNYGYIYRLAKHVISIDDIPENPEENLDEPTKVSVNESLRFVEMLRGGDSSKLKDAIAKCDCGLDTTFNAECVDCGEEFKAGFEFTPEFFRPESGEV